MALALQNFSTVKDANAALKAAGTRYLGGGTLVVRAANEGDVSVSSLIRSTEPALSAITVSGSEVRIGASVTMAAIARHPDLTSLSHAARAVGGPAIRNMATVGGNLFAPAPYGDFTVALLALEAVVGTDDGEVPIEAFLAKRESNHAIVTSVDFSLPVDGGFRFLKVSRVKPKGVSVLSIAAVLEQAPDGTVSSAHIALGCMADRPMRAKAAEKALLGRKLTSDGIAPALAVASDGTSPITDPIASAWYRNEVLPVHLGRLLLA
ncbi:MULTISPECIES: xanthine dehydrogenase family protein subunit M [unclassified Mesorhizobium]|uniref:FAD binding domain-containing protein n=1 Tax=unclassified Mesorhizobium TaxID=325217 RepID=UPI000FE96499|nr:MULTISPECIES: FAD binding domain-containing protein [unclassified Mesorhizobium]RWI20558.1 MAG: xanthine dehydrogenase family protein subunit M [Mesorhizobium sp.]RWK49852.1 MAG: xanthine dehydrogenase family protein subunit M [Mesorhizobium sp.]RWK93865.1 MAG: xanthine dehydrogenase family protein subunit M [Mesorhizobium sp.]RWL13844.1 MAG: xanthine dehydrogenase family protein subunit M [Mesorhizobium sp.]TIP59355.1 MAG: xanthine dehydrogenase family protein subunit M [Mesorhizobium sp.]